jgi:Xaa-Pro aminopeptidase
MHLPFNKEKLDRLLDAEGIDFLLINDKNTAQYLLGGYKFFFFAQKDAIGISRYLPTIGYPKDKPEDAFYIGHMLEAQQQQVEPLWINNIQNIQWNTQQAGKEAAKQIKKLGYSNKRIGIEFCNTPTDTFLMLKENLPNAEFVDVLVLMQELRAVKTDFELDLLKNASNFITTSMERVMKTSKPGTNTQSIAQALKEEETNFGMNFEYCLVAAGKSYNRTPSDKLFWNKGDVLSLDSGANLNGYLGDLCRMAVMGKPTDTMIDFLSQVRAINDAPRKVIHEGITGNEILEEAYKEINKCDKNLDFKFVAHGMGMIQHEAPHIYDKGIIPYPAPYKDKALEAGMVLSIETDLKYEGIGFIKLEDTVVVKENGFEAFGDNIRDWVCNDQD